MKRNLLAKEPGTVLVICMILLVILSLMGAVAIMTTSTEVRIAANSRKSEQAFYAADAGIERARTQVGWEDNTGDVHNSLAGDPFAYQTTVLGRVNVSGDVRVFNVESRGQDPFNRSQRIIRADIEITRTRGSVDEGGYGGGY